MTMFLRSLCCLTPLTMLFPLTAQSGSQESREELRFEQQRLVQRLQAEVDELGIESDGNGWRAKVFVYCVEARCPQSGWMVPALPTLVISKGYRVIAQLIPYAKK